MNYYNTLPQRIKLEELGTCRFMSKSEFNGVEKLKGKKNRYRWLRCSRS